MFKAPDGSGGSQLVQPPVYAPNKIDLTPADADLQITKYEVRKSLDVWKARPVGSDGEWAFFGTREEALAFVKQKQLDEAQALITDFAKKNPLQGMILGFLALAAKKSLDGAQLNTGDTLGNQESAG